MYPDAMVPFGRGCERMRRGNGAAIRCAHSCAVLSPDATRGRRHEESPGGRYPASTPDYACVRVCGGSNKAATTRIGRVCPEVDFRHVVAA